MGQVLVAGDLYLGHQREILYPKNDQFERRFGYIWAGVLIILVVDVVGIVHGCCFSLSLFKIEFGLTFI